MSVTRRTFIRAAVAGTALATVATTAEGTFGAIASAAAASPPGDVVGKVTVGYQGWFAAKGDSSPIDGWWHWGVDWGRSPQPGNVAVSAWPDVRDYTRTYPTAFANLGNGEPATLYSNYDRQTVDTHFRWMRDYGIDTAALQRFNPVYQEGRIRDAIVPMVRDAAETYGRKFYVMYDVTSWTAMREEIKADWTTKMKAYTSSPAYARQNGRPVVCIWGFGFSEDSRPFTPEECQDVVDWFTGQGVYLIGGVPTWWRKTGAYGDSRAGFDGVYRSFDAISPWMVFRTGDLPGLDWYLANVNTGDLAECQRLGIDYLPCVMPGDLSQGHRRHGDFYWRHIYNMVGLGAQGLYVSMFDEYNEGNQIAKTAEDRSQVPADFTGRTLDEDGTFCSSDYYLRITGDGGRMLKGLIPLTAVRPTPPVVAAAPQLDDDSEQKVAAEVQDDVAEVQDDVQAAPPQQQGPSASPPPPASPAVASSASSASSSTSLVPTQLSSGPVTTVAAPSDGVLGVTGSSPVGPAVAGLAAIAGGVAAVLAKRNRGKDSSQD